MRGDREYKRWNKIIAAVGECGNKEFSNVLSHRASDGSSDRHLKTQRYNNIGEHDGGLLRSEYPVK